MGLSEPKFMRDKYSFFDEKERVLKIKNDAPDWAKQEFEDFNRAVNPTPDENGVITQI